MNGDANEGREITLEQLAELRGKTEVISRWLRSELEGHLETLKPLFAPRRLLGDFVRGSENVKVPDAERTFDKLREAYQTAAGDPLNLPLRLEAPLEPIPNELALLPWESVRDVEGGHRITTRSPVSWILMHASPLGPAEARSMLEGRAKRNETALRKLVVHALVMKLLLDRNPGIARLLLALRYRVEMTTLSGLGRLPIARLSSVVPSFRPDDRTLINATRLSGTSIFEELIDLEALATVPDPLVQEALHRAS